MSPRSCARRGAMTLVEVVVAMALLGLVLVSLLQGASVSVRMQRATLDQVTAGALARELLEFICELQYAEGAAASLGVDAAENSAIRTLFDDVDDFDGWSESPPLRPDGTAMPGMGAWTRQVTVDYVDPDDPATVVAGDQGAKLVRVTVLLGSKVVADLERVCYRSMEEAEQ